MKVARMEDFPYILPYNQTTHHTLLLAPNSNMSSTSMSLCIYL